jgi:diguanylate cyclase (GGDEF)-like protein
MTAEVNPGSDNAAQLLVGDADRMQAPNHPLSGPDAGSGRESMLAKGAAARVLVIDDDPIFRRVASVALRRAGFKVQAAADGTEGLREAERLAPDLVILDAVMEGLDGFEVCRRLRGMGPLAEVPVLMITGLADPEAIHWAFQVGAWDFDTKPVSSTLLVHRARFLIRAGRDAAALRRAEARLKEMAYFDGLTGLASRDHFKVHLTGACAAARRRGEQLALVFLDLDGFKDVNDSFGHDAGDLLLGTLARRLRQCLRDGDFAARLGGDELCLLLSGVRAETDAAEVAERCLQAINRPVSVGGRALRPRASIGIALYPRDGSDPQELLMAADAAMYAAKRGGRHCYTFYRPELTAQARLRLELEEELRRAVAGGGLELYYQPLVAGGDGRVHGVEALVYWPHRVHGLIPPGEFIPTAERIGLMVSLGAWVLSSACRQAAEWRQRGLPPVIVGVNVSPLQFRDPALPERVREVLEETGLAPGSLCLEVTEGVTQATEESRAILLRLKALGVRVAIDDFGTGCSSLASLRHLPIDCLKVDRLLVCDLLADPRAVVLLETIVRLAHALGMRVVAEGAETALQVQALSDIGCDLIQGLHYSPPVPAEQIPALLHTEWPPSPETLANPSLSNSHLKI